jgi:hypothetical protein
MLTQDPKKKKIYKILLDIISALAIITFINVFLGWLFGVTIPILNYIGLTAIIALIYFILMFKFAKLTKKWGWIILESLIIIGPIIRIIASYLYTKFLVESGAIYTLIEEMPSTLNPLSGKISSIAPLGIQILSYGGSILFLVGLLSAIVFYFRFYRKYLSGQLSLKELGVEQVADEHHFIQQWQERGKKQNKVGWIIIIILVLIFIGVLLYLQFG